MKFSKNVVKYLFVMLYISIILVSIFSVYLINPVFAYDGNDNIETRGLYTRVSQNLESINGVIRAIAKNTITIMPSEVNVYVYLYSSTTYKSSYLDMDLRDWNYAQDLNLGKTLVAESSTYGEQLFWRVRVRFRVDGGEWKEEIGETYLIDGDGNILK